MNRYFVSWLKQDSRLDAHIYVELLGVCLSVLLVLSSAMAHSSDMPSLDSMNESPIDLSPHISYFAEEYIPRDLAFARSYKDWQTANGSVNFGFNADNYWLRVDLTNLVKPSDDVLIEVDYSFLDYADAFFIVDGEVASHQKSGDSYPTSTRPISSPTILFDPPHQFTNSLKLYVRIQSDGAVKAPMFLWDQAKFQSIDLVRQSANGIFAGAILIMILYHVFLFSILRELSVFIYILYLGSYLLLQLVISSHGLYLYWPDYSEWNNTLLLLATNLSSFLGVSFSYVFLSLHRMSWKVQLLPVVLIINSFTFLVLMPFLSYETQIFPNILIIAVNTVFSIFVGFYLWLIKGIRIARFFSIAWGVFVLGTVIFYMALFDYIATNAFTNNVISISALIQMALHSLALADKFREERITSEKNITELNEQLEQRVLRRTQQLEQSVDKLQQTQKELVQSEKMAALGNLVAGVAHEINTPLGIGISATSLLHDRSQELDKRYSEGELDRSTMEDYIDVAKESTSLVLSNLEKASRQISNFKTVAVDQSHETLRCFNVKEYLEELSKSFSNKLKAKNVTIHLHCDEHLAINSYPGLFAQLFSHLIVNSLDHGFKDQEYGDISISIGANEDELTIEYKDDGKGVAKSEQAHLFEPFYTTGRSKGHTGLGTFVIFNTVTHGLGGRISHTSQEEKGLKYHILIPLNTCETE